MPASRHRLYKKKPFPVADVRRFLEPGPILLVSSVLGGKTDIMTLGWHTVMEFTPSLVGCMISAANYSFDMIYRSRECVLNLPTRDLAKAIAGIGSCSGARVDKFAHFGLTPQKATAVSCPLIGECYASFECRVKDPSWARKYNFFVLEVVTAHVAPSPKYPRTLHYRGDGLFMVSGTHVRIPSLK